MGYLYHFTNVQSLKCTWKNIQIFTLSWLSNYLFYYSFMFSLPAQRTWTLFNFKKQIICIAYYFNSLRNIMYQIQFSSILFFKFHFGSLYPDYLLLFHSHFLSLSFSVSPSVSVFFFVSLYLNFSPSVCLYASLFYFKMKDYFTWYNFLYKNNLVISFNQRFEEDSNIFRGIFLEDIQHEEFIFTGTSMQALLLEQGFVNMVKLLNLTASACSSAKWKQYASYSLYNS